MRRRADGSRLQSRADENRKRGRFALGQHEGEGSRPEAFGKVQGQRIEADDLLRLAPILDMHDQRVEPGSLLGRKNRGNRDIVERIGAQAIHGLRREGDKPSFPEPPSGLGDGVGCRRTNAGYRDECHRNSLIAAGSKVRRRRVCGIILGGSVTCETMLMRRISAFLCVFAIATGLAGAGTPATEQAVPPNSVITLQRGACERRCAVYKVIVFADGTLIYDGQYFVRRSGLVLDRIGSADIARLISSFEAIGYFGLHDDYGVRDTSGCGALLSDAPIAMTSIVTGAKVKAIVHHHRCTGAVSDSLSRIEDEIDKIGRTSRWIK